MKPDELLRGTKEAVIHKVAEKQFGGKKFSFE